MADDFAEVDHLIDEHNVTMRQEAHGVGLCMYGIWMLVPRAWESHARGWLHVLRYAPLIKAMTDGHTPSTA